MSTRLYVAVVTTVALGVLLSAMSAAAYGALAFSLRGQLDQGLAAEGRQLRDYFLASADSPFTGNTLPVSAAPFEAVAPSGSLFRLVGADGRVLAQSLGGLAAPLGRSAYGAPGAGPQGFAYETVAHAETRFRVYSLPVRLPAHTTGVLQIARPLAPVEETLAQLRLVLIAATGVGLLCAVGVGLLVAHAAAKPIEDVASATARIRAFGEEDERLALSGRLQEPHWLAQSLNQLLDRVARAEAAAGDADRVASADSVPDAAAIRAQCAAYVQSQLGRLIAQQRSLNAFLRAELRPDDARAQALEEQQRGALQDFLRTEPRRWTEAYDDAVVWLEAQTAALERWLRRLPRSLDAQETWEPAREEVSLAPLLSLLCQEKRDQYADSVKIACKLPCTPRLHADRRSLRAALAVLIDAACARAPAGESVTVTLREAAAWVTITVAASGAGPTADAGAGVAADDLPQIPTLLAGETDAGAGRGVGLPFAHDVIARHGGTLTVESAPGEGSAFTARLPREESGAHETV